MMFLKKEIHLMNVLAFSSKGFLNCRCPQTTQRIAAAIEAAIESAVNPGPADRCRHVLGASITVAG
jgi:hypothetical protein